MQPHDLVVLATDGVWDNLFESEIQALIDATMTEPPPWLETEITNLASTIASAAEATAHSKTKTTPFVQTAAEAGHRFVGGKLDDISVVVAVIDGVDC